MRATRTGHAFALTPYNLFAVGVGASVPAPDRQVNGPASQRSGDPGILPRIDKLPEIRNYHRAMTAASKVSPLQ
jgi:hypothetical protein